MPDGGAPATELRAYFRGIDAALSLLGRRLGAHPELDLATALSELERYHRVVRENIAILEAAESGQPAAPDRG
jgi:hypothetical protein